MSQVRPHPGLWRIVHGASVVYLLLLAAMAVQNRQGVIASLQLLFPEVGNTKKVTAPKAPLECEINADVSGELNCSVLIALAD